MLLGYAISLCCAWLTRVLTPGVLHSSINVNVAASATPLVGRSFSAEAVTTLMSVGVLSLVMNCSADLGISASVDAELTVDGDAYLEADTSIDLTAEGIASVERYFTADAAVYTETSATVLQARNLSSSISVDVDASGTLTVTGEDDMAWSVEARATTAITATSYSSVTVDLTSYSLDSDISRYSVRVLNAGNVYQDSSQNSLGAFAYLSSNTALVVGSQEVAPYTGRLGKISWEIVDFLGGA